MSASVASVAQASPPRTTPTRDPPRAVAFSGVLSLLLAALLVLGGDNLAGTLSVEWKPLLFWALLVMVLSFLPIAVEDARLTLDDPILLAIAFLYPPEVGALVALVASCDVREIRGEVAVSRALFNRVQIGLCVYLAAATFRYVTHGNLDPWPIAAMGTGAAVAAEYITNVVLVSIHARALWRLDWRVAVRRLKVGNAGQFLVTHLGYGFLALVVARLFQDVGTWSVTTFLIPILVARQMLVRGQAIHALAERLRNRDRLLEKLSDRIVDERRDERLRLAGDLHDEVLQALTRIWLSARLVASEQGAMGSVSSDVKELVQASDTSIESLRQVIHDLKESSMGWGGLIPTLRGLVQDLRLEWRANIRLNLPDGLEMEPGTQFVAYQVVREALINSLKHSQASLIVVSVEARETEVAVQVEDNGVGFAFESVDSSMHFGLGLMEDRVNRAGGRIRIQSNANQGTTVRVYFPLQPEGTSSPRITDQG